MGTLLSASAYPMIAPVAAATALRIPSPLPLRCTLPMAESAGFVAAISRTISRVPSLPSAATMIWYDMRRESK